MKKIIIASILVAGLVASYAYAYDKGSPMPGGGYGMMGAGYSMMDGGYGDCAGSAWLGGTGENTESYRKFLEDTVDLRKEMNGKRFEYVEARRNPNATREQLAMLEEEMLDIRTKLQEKTTQYR